MTEKHLADRWQISLKTMRRWRYDDEGPVWYKLFHHVRYHEADILEFERRGAQHLMTLLGINRVLKPADEDVGAAFDAQGSRYLSAKDIAEAASLPIHIFQDRAERERKQIPHQIVASPFRGLSGCFQQQLIENQVQPPAEFETYLWQRTNVPEAKLLMQRDASGIGGINAANHGMNIVVPGFVNQSLHDLMAQSMTAMVPVHVHRVFHCVLVRRPCAECAVAAKRQ